MTHEKWLAMITDFALSTNWVEETYPGFTKYSIQRHHLFGRKAKAKINLVSENIGEKAVLIVPYELHDISSGHSCNVTHCKREFEKQYGKQADLFEGMLKAMEQHGFKHDITPDILTAIKEK